MFHVREIIAHHAILHIELLREEAQQARNKECQLYERDFSKLATNEHIIHSPLISSDSFQICGLYQKKIKSYPADVLAMLEASLTNVTESEDRK